MSPGANTTVYSYTGSELSRLVDDAGTNAYSYEPDGTRLLASLNASLGSAVITYGYDSFGRPSSRSDGSGLMTCISDPR